MKLKKLLAGILSAAMVLGTMVMPAFADSDVPTLDPQILSNDEIAAIFQRTDYYGGSNEYVGAGAKLDKVFDALRKKHNEDTSNLVYGMRLQGQSDTKNKPYSNWLFDFDITTDEDVQLLVMVGYDMFFGHGLMYYMPVLKSGEVRHLLNGTLGWDVNYGTYGKDDIECIVIPLTEELFTVMYDLYGTENHTYEQYKSSLLGTDEFTNFKNVSSENANLTLNGVFYETSKRNQMPTATKHYTDNAPITFEYKVPSVFIADNQTVYSTFEEAYENATTSIDMCGSTVNVDSAIVISKDITIQNGKFDISNFILANGNGIFDVNANVTFNNVSIVGEDYSSAYSVMFTRNDKVVTLNNCTFDLENELMESDGDTTEDIGGVLKSNSASGKFIINGGTYTLKNTVRGIADASVEIDGATITATHTNTSTAHFFRNVFGTIKNSTISADNFQNGIKNTDEKALEISANTEITLTNMEENSVQLSGNATLDVDDSSSVTMTNSNVAAKISNVYYATLDEALKAAQTGETITLLADTSIGNVNDFRNDIDLNGKTLTLTGNRYYLNNAGIDVTFKNGTIIAAPTEKTKSSDALINCFGDVRDSKTETLTFDNIEFYSDGFEHDDAPYSGYLFQTSNGSSFNAINGTTFDIKNSECCAVFCNNAPTGGSEIAFDGTTITVENTDTAFLHAASFKDSTVTLTNVTDGLKNGANNTKFVVDNSTITALGGENGAKLYAETSIEFINGSTFTANKILLKDDKASVINENDNSTINAEIVTEKITGPVANTVKVVYEDVTENEGEKVYDIYVVAEENTINRLTAVQMALNLTTTDAFEMTVTAAEGVTRSFENGMYLFNFDGETKPSATGTKIKLGQVKLVGYGTFTLAIDETKDNKAHATTNEGENLVTDFVPDAVDGQGKFDISASLEDIEVKEATRNLTINIDFNHAVENQVADYQDMTVTVTGPDAYEKVFKLGSDETEIVDNKVTIEIKDELVLNTTYNVEVKGAGYRTALYSVNMNADKTLNFWNNYKDTAVNVEENKDATAKNTTFLAGELVKDGKINIYDLSAVVSYFGTINDVTDESAYAKYDLNRDGKIDSKDVAYVLVSWGK